ncbi:MAG: glycosyltransferase family 4 protein [Methylococcaceae bacterium]|nr:glycosyltransferase family 4 protein [Methylococcaceae bacterium]
MSWKGKRIALVGPLPPPAGGMANQTRQLAELLRQEGLHVEVVQVNSAYWPAWVGGLPVIRAFFRLLPYIYRLWKGVGQSDLVHVMANSGWSWHLSAAPAIWISRLRGIPVFVNYRGGEAATFLKKSARWVRPTMRLSRGLLVPSGFLLQIFKHYGMSSRIVPNIVDTRLFSPAKNRSVDSDFHVVVARNLEPIYDVATAIRAFALILLAFPQSRMSVAGTGPDLERLKALCDELDIQAKVSFTGRLDRDQMAALYQDAGVMINSSLVDNMPNSVLEALSSGCPVVSTAVGGVPFLVKDGQTALLVPPADPQALADASCRVLGDRELRARLIEAGLFEVQKYTWAAVRDELRSVYEAALP